MTTGLAEGVSGAVGGASLVVVEPLAPTGFSRAGSATATVAAPMATRAPAPMAAATRRMVTALVRRERDINFLSVLLPVQDWCP